MAIVKGVAALGVMLALIGCAHEIPRDDRIPTYDQASAALQKQIPESAQQNWADDELASLFGGALDDAMEACLSAGVQAPNTVARLVIDSETGRIGDEAPTAFSSCLSARLQSWTWPKSPHGLRYLPIEVSMTVKDDEPDPDAAERLIDSVKGVDPK
jgi:hypothetical protein